jgi:hypothetical protein
MEKGKTMALYNPGGDAKAIVKFDAKQGVCKIDNDQVPLKSFKAVFDMDAMELGYCKFGEATVPEFRMAPASDAAAVEALERPNVVGADGKPAFKWGFRLNLKLTKELAGNSPSVREFASNSYVTFNGVDALHDEWSNERDKNPGKFPVVAGKTTIAIPGAFGKNHQPVFGIVGWIDPPADLLEARNGNAAHTPVRGDVVPAHVTEVEGEPEALEPVDFSEDGKDF